MSPAYVPPEEAERILLDLYQILSDISNSPLPPILEDDAYEKLEASNRFPCEKVFARNIVSDGESTFSAQDVTRVVNNILSKGLSLSDSEIVYVAEWGELATDPEIHSISNERNKEILQLISDIAIHNSENDEKLCTLHYCATKAPSRLVRGVLNNALPSNVNFPAEINEIIKEYFNYKFYLSEATRERYARTIITEYSYKQIVFSIALSLIKEKGDDLDALEWDDFDFSADFIASLDRNQANHNAQYFNVTIECISHILAGIPKNSLNPFLEAKGSTKQRSHGNYLAYRTHITKSGVALRLMFWKDASNHIVFANIGPKNELFIANP